MDLEYFVKKVEFLCSLKGIKPTTACRKCGLGTSFLPDVKRGRIPSVVKCAQLAAYLGTTVSDLIGETAPTSMAIPEHPTLILRYNQLSPDDQEEIMDMIESKIRRAAEKEKRQKKEQGSNAEE